LGGVTAPCGFEASGVRCGIKTRGKDVSLVYSVSPAVTAGVFTRNRVQAAPVLVSKDRVGQAKSHGVIINSGNANACTGVQGYLDAIRMAALTAELLEISERSILVCSTGVIGERLPMSKVTIGIKKAVAELSPEGGGAAAEAILTTDTETKMEAVEFDLDGRPVRVGGMAKGAGMIAPNLATMLAIITTDAMLAPSLLKSCLTSAVERTFNRITVDGDTSTNDTVLLLANGQAEAGEIMPRHGLRRFQAALDHVCGTLAEAIISDAEGASKTVVIRVEGGRTEREALQVARTIANSPLVKTALSGGDPNWGRILAAAGRAGVRFAADAVQLWLGDVRVVREGAACTYDVKAAEKAVAGPDVRITIDLNMGEETAAVRTCDLSAEYVRINSAYHT
jgi:glutamate N-acetyltransferase/amino-acid N-acetyltransferase